MKKLIRQPAQNTDIRTFMFIWETTMACDLVCLHCRAEAIPRKDPRRLTINEGKRLLEQIVGFGKPTPIVVLTGGDPFKREDIREQDVMTWSVFFLVPTGRGLIKDEITCDEYEDVMNWLYDTSRYIRIKTTEGHHYKRVVIQLSILEEEHTDPIREMCLGKTYLTLRDQLNRYACEVVARIC